MNAALPSFYSHVPAQRFWAHKIRNILHHVRRADPKAVKKTTIGSAMPETFGRLKRPPNDSSIAGKGLILGLPHA